MARTTSRCTCPAPSTPQSDRVDSTQFSLEELNAIVEEATAANIYVAGHAYTSRAINRGLQCGVRSIEHGNLMDRSSIPLFLQYGAFYVPTIMTYHTLAEKSRDGLLPPTSTPSCTRSSAGRSARWRWRTRLACRSCTAPTCSPTCTASNCRSSSSAPKSSPPPTSSAPRPPPQRGCCGGGQLGVVAPGAYADLLVIDGNPLDDIRLLTTPDRTLRLIMKEGVVYKNEL